MNDTHIDDKERFKYYKKRYREIQHKNDELRSDLAQVLKTLKTDVEEMNHAFVLENQTVKRVVEELSCELVLENQAVESVIEDLDYVLAETDTVLNDIYRFMCYASGKYADSGIVTPEMLASINVRLLKMRESLCCLKKKLATI